MATIGAPKAEEWVRQTPQGLCCEPGGFFIDPSRAGRPRRRSPMAMPTMPGPATARCWRRPRRSPSCGARYGEEAGRHAAGAAPMARRLRDRRRHGPAGAGRPCAGLAQVVLEWQRQPRRRLRRLQAARRSDLRRPSSRCTATSSSPRRPSACRCSAIRRRRTRSAGCCIRCALFPERAHVVGVLCARQVPAGDRAAARGRLRRADLPAWRAGRAVRALRGARRAAGRRCGPRPAPTKDELRRADRAGAALGRRRTAGRGGCPIRWSASPPAGCACEQRAKAARRRAAAGDLRPCRLGRADRRRSTRSARRRSG